MKLQFNTRNCIATISLLTAFAALGTATQCAKADAVAVAASTAVQTSAAAPQTVACEPSEDFGYRLPEGVTVQMIGVSPSVAAQGSFASDRQWWMPNGVDLRGGCKTVADLKAYSGQAAGERYREFVFYVIDSRKKPVAVTTTVVAPSELASVDDTSSIYMHGSLRHVGTYASDATASTMYVGLAATDWQDVAVCKGTMGASVTAMGNKTVLFSQAYQFDGGTLVPISDNLMQPTTLPGQATVDALDFRVVAIDKDGHTVVADRLKSGGATAEFRLTTAVFKHIGPDRLIEIHVQVRPFHYVKFPAVALDPINPVSTVVDNQVRMTER